MGLELSTAATIRSFIGIPLTESGRQLCETLAASMKSRVPSSVRWVAGDNFHITLLFLGNQSPVVLDALASRLSLTLAQQPSFDLHTKHISTFPDAKSGILALELSPCAELLLLRDKIQQAALKTGIRDFDSHSSFRPHITLGRFRSRTETGICNTKAACQFRVQSVALFESVTRAGGAQYRTRFKFDFYSD
ncbi:MAG: RNA 2',3'-cyclic phosphodiesterase [Ketobacter sp.]|nr:MAG: RNA 2',3'-cyclic phosphodiesterase [Ketobacter sp.]